MNRIRARHRQSTTTTAGCVTTPPVVAALKPCGFGTAAAPVWIGSQRIFYRNDPFEAATKHLELERLPSRTCRTVPMAGRRTVVTNKTTYASRTLAAVRSLSLPLPLSLSRFLPSTLLPRVCLNLCTAAGNDTVIKLSSFTSPPVTWPPSRQRPFPPPVHGRGYLARFRPRCPPGWQQATSERRHWPADRRRRAGEVGLSCPSRRGRVRGRATRNEPAIDRCARDSCGAPAAATRRRPLTAGRHRPTAARRQSRFVSIGRCYVPCEPGRPPYSSARRLTWAAACGVHVRTRVCACVRVPARQTEFERATRLQLSFGRQRTLPDGQKYVRTVLIRTANCVGSASSGSPIGARPSPHSSSDSSQRPICLLPSSLAYELVVQSAAALLT